MENKSGGFLVGRKNGKTYVHNDGNLGGFLVGRRHSEGGIKGQNESTGQPIEVESAELVINKNSVTSNDKKEFEGKMMTNREILSNLNVEGGGVSFSEGGNIEQTYKTDKNLIDKNAGNPITYGGGEAILTRGAVSSKKKYSYEGKMLTTREIASDINVKGGGVAFADGGDVPEKINCGCSHMSVGGETYTPQDFITLSEKHYQEGRLIDGIEKERKDHFYTLAKLNSGAITIEQALREIASKEMMIDANYPYSE